MTIGIILLVLGLAFILTGVLAVFCCLIIAEDEEGDE